MINGNWFLWGLYKYVSNGVDGIDIMVLVRKTDRLMETMIEIV